VDVGVVHLLELAVVVGLEESLFSEAGRAVEAVGYRGEVLVTEAGEEVPAVVSEEAVAGVEGLVAVVAVDVGDTEGHTRHIIDRLIHTDPYVIHLHPIMVSYF
jgi:hypothetical protein